MKDTIFYVGGSKGGVGKSIVALTLVQFLIDRYGDAKTVHVIETDESNPEEGRQKPRVIGHDSTDLRLLQHDFREVDASEAVSEELTLLGGDVAVVVRDHIEDRKSVV